MSELEAIRQEAAFRRTQRQAKAVRARYLRAMEPELTLVAIGRRLSMSQSAVHRALGHVPSVD